MAKDVEDDVERVLCMSLNLTINVVEDVSKFS